MNDTTLGKPTVLFLCTGNSCRSQMAEGWTRHLLNDQFEAYSAGIEKHGLNPLAVKAMAEGGVDISRYQSNLIDELPVKQFDYVITVCGHANETCPYFPGPVIHKGFSDPPKLAEKETTEEKKLTHYRMVRDQIREYVLSLPEILLNR